jgi:hypothetical protein
MTEVRSLLPCIDVGAVAEKSMKEDHESSHWSSDPARYCMMVVELGASDSHRLTRGHRDRNRDGYYSHLYLHLHLHLYKAVPRPPANRRRKEYEVGGELQGEGSNDVGSVVWGIGR